ncbi:MAG TPA: hypothetical protein PLC54_08320, partial [Spirochaetales bacterium]|nr:hypothetical protein [Spirochaetales bacterium]
MKRGARALTLIVVLIIACLVAWPIVRIANAAKAGQEAARASFLDIRRQAINALAAPEQASGQNWQAVARTAWSANPRLLSVVVSRRDDGVLFAMPAASMYYQETKAGQAPSYNFPKSVISSFQGPLASGMMIETLFTTLSQQDVFIALRDSSIAVLALILIAAGWLLASPADAEQLSRHANADSMYRQPLDADSDSIASKYLSGLEQARVDAQANAGAPTDVSEQPEAGAQTKAGAPVKTGALDANKQDSAQAVPMDGLSMQTENHGKELRCKDLPGADLAGPKGLFDPETGLGWESYLRERLSAELKRSASFEQDLCLLLAALDDTARGQ